MPLLRNQRSAVYHICARCGTRQQLDKMVWQNGKLFCKPENCVDTAIQGSRDLNVARQVSINRHELEPDPKLVNPVDRRNDQLEVLY